MAAEKSVMKNNLKVQLMANRDEVAEDEHQCHYCTDFAYLSMIKCSNHKFNYCLYHSVICGCSYGNIVVEYRYSNKELDELERLIDKECEGWVEEDEGSDFGKEQKGLKGKRGKKGL